MKTTHVPLYLHDRPALRSLQTDIEARRDNGQRVNQQDALGYAITAGLVVGRLMEALEPFVTASIEGYADVVNDAALALYAARKELKGAQR